MIKAVFFDIDGTLTPLRSSWEYLLRKTGVWDRVRGIWDSYRRGFTTYEEISKLEAREFAGLSKADVADHLGAIPYRPWAVECVRAIGDAGIVTGTVSTGLSLLIDRIAAECGLHRWVSNKLVESETDGRTVLTGEVELYVTENSGPLSKSFWIKRFIAELGLEPSEVMAVGDSVGDIPMLLEVGTPVLFSCESGEEQRISSEIPGLRTIMDLRQVLDILRLGTISTTQIREVEPFEGRRRVFRGIREREGKGGARRQDGEGPECP